MSAAFPLFSLLVVLVPTAAIVVALVLLGQIGRHLKSIARSLDARAKDPR